MGLAALLRPDFWMLLAGIIGSLTCITKLTRMTDLDRQAQTWEHALYFWLAVMAAGVLSLLWSMPKGG